MDSTLARLLPPSLFMQPGSAKGPLYSTTRVFPSPVYCVVEAEGGGKALKDSCRCLPDSSVAWGFWIRRSVEVVMARLRAPLTAETLIAVKLRCLCLSLYVSFSLHDCLYVSVCLVYFSFPISFSYQLAPFICRTSIRSLSLSFSLLLPCLCLFTFPSVC